MKDDWRAETQLRLKESLIYKALKSNCEDNPKCNQVLHLVDEAVYYSYQRTKTIIRHMGEFTLHDGDHLFRVLELMEKLLGEGLIQKLTVPELYLLVLTAFFHDIGMAPDEEDVLSWKKVWDKHPELTEGRAHIEYDKFKRFCAARPSKSEEIASLQSKGKESDAELRKGYLLAEYIRITHANRAAEVIERDWNNKILYGETDLTVEFASLCYSHNEDALQLLNLDTEMLCGSDTHACLPLIGILLRLADILDFDAKRTPEILYSHLWVRNAVSLKEWNRHRSIDAWIISPDKIQFHAKCEHPAVEASIHDFCDEIDNELSTCRSILSEIDKRTGRNRVKLEIPLRVDRDKIETKKSISREPIYIYRRTEFNLSKKQVIDLLMGTKLYGNPEVALRELLQNSIDACLLRKSLEKKWGNNYAPEIEVKYYTEDEMDILEVRDNGIGMDQDIIDN